MKGVPVRELLFLLDDDTNGSDLFKNYLLGQMTSIYNLITWVIDRLLPWITSMK